MKNNKLIKNNKSILLLLILLSGITSPLFSESFSPKIFDFRKEIKPPAKVTGTWGSVDLDEEIYRNSFYSDLRLVANGKLISFSREDKISSLGKSGFVVPKVIFKNDENEKTIYVLELSSIPDDSIIETLEVKSDGAFESNLQIKMGNKIDKWEDTRSEFLFQYANEFSTQEKYIRIQSIPYRFIRIEADKLLNLQFPRVKYGNSSKISELSFDIDVPEPSIDSDSESSVYYFSNESNLPFTKIKLQFNEKDFSRFYRVYYFGENKEYTLASEGYVDKNSRSSKNQIIYQELILNQKVKSKWKLEIQNGDDKPLNLEKVTLLHPLERLIISNEELENLSADDKFYLYYGNRYIKPPKFDLTAYYNSEIKNPDSYALGKEESNPDKSWSLVHPPVSIWIIRFLFLLGLAGVGFLSYKILVRYSRFSSETISSPSK